MQALEKRLTHKYVGEYQHLDQWATIGTIDEIGKRELPLSEEDECDPCDPKSWEIFVLVKPSPDLFERWTMLNLEDDPDLDYFKWSQREIRQALHDTYTQWGCAHEWDCCGCRSYHASEEKVVTGDLWRVVVSSSRNY